VLYAREEKIAAMESEPAAVSRPVEQAEYGTGGDAQAARAENRKSSSGTDTSYAVIIKYDNAYVKSNDGILRLLHIVGCFYFGCLVCRLNACFMLKMHQG